MVLKQAYYCDVCNAIISYGGEDIGIPGVLNYLNIRIRDTRFMREICDDCAKAIEPELDSIRTKLVPQA